ncbi:NADP-dependent oxidoreductase [Williamsia herbipolensis]|uniref:NADP-dependent oxidoreductase n=1 Tax=Williamsia herbipolensis TaxID=1603258 RepID=UPI0005F88195|nr:NADP-dependent oxidoreductase [Williamsia herbipolensis]
MTSPQSARRIVLAARPHGEPQDSDVRFEEFSLPEPREGQVLLQTLDLSLDPYMRGRMSSAKSYAPPVEIDAPMVGATVSRVLASRDPGFSEGDVVLGYGGWQTHSVESTAHLRKLDADSAVPHTTALGVLGMPGFTAYSGLLTIGRPQPGETVVVAAATGPVGSAVGQIAKIKGARAVGIAGGPDKVAYLRDELGFDAAIDHRADDFAEQLAAATGDGIDVYFENVGGKVFDAVLPRMNTYGRIPVCGLGVILRSSLTVRGFIQTEFAAEQQETFLSEASQWVADGLLKYLEHVVDGFDNTLDAFRDMLAGRSFGKTVVHVAD